MSKHILLAALAAAFVAGLAVPAPVQAGPKWLERLKGDNAEEAEQSEADAKAEEPAKQDSGKKQGGKSESSSTVRQVKGLNGYSGEIIGKPVPNSPFNKLQIGMPQKQVFDLVGPSDDGGSYSTAKSYIPFAGYGGDTMRNEEVFKGLGRLIYTNANNGGTYLIKIIHDASEDGYR